MPCREEMKGLFTGYVAIPTGVAIFPRELYKPPRSWANALYNIVHWTEQPKVCLRCKLPHCAILRVLKLCRMV
jgi:hypothetical protein